MGIAGRQDHPVGRAEEPDPICGGKVGDRGSPGCLGSLREAGGLDGGGKGPGRPSPPGCTHLPAPVAHR